MIAETLVLFLAIAQPSSEADEVVHLRSALAEHPEDVDVRLRLALALSRRGQTEESRVHAEAVVSKAPAYWDAHLLLARLDAWEERYDEARDRLQRVIASAPDLRDARMQLAEVELWSGELHRSRATLESMLERERSADLLGRLAQVEYELHHHLAAYLVAGDALEIDPRDERALGVREAVTLVRADLRFEAENLPGPKDGHGEIASITLLPGNHYAFTITEEFRQRYGTTNNRLAFDALWIPASGWLVGASFGFGLPAEVIAELSAGARVLFPIFGPIDGGLSYSFDRFPDNVLLHRARADLGFRVHDTTQVVLAYVFGVLMAEPQPSGSLHYGEAEVRWELAPYSLAVGYGAGRQLDRIVVDRSLLFSYFVHEPHLFAAYEPAKWIRIGVDLRTSIRTNDTRVDTLGILARFSI